MNNIEYSPCSDFLGDFELWYWLSVIYVVVLDSLNKVSRIQ